MGDYSGFAALGDLVMGGPGRRAKGEYFKGVKEGASASEMWDKAREERARSMAREMLPDATRTMFKSRGLSDADAEYAVQALSMAHYQPNLGQVTGGLRDLGDVELERQQLEAFKAGNITLANQLASVRDDKGKPYEPVRQVAGNLIPSGVALGDPGFEVRALPQTTATVDLRHAQTARALRPPTPHALKPLGEGASEEQLELSKARKILQRGVPRQEVIDLLKSRGWAHLAKKL